MSSPIYDPGRTFLVDSNSTQSTFLIRGNQPLRSDGVSFAYSELNEKLQQILPGAIGQSFQLNNYNLLDISLIDDVEGSERSVLQPEFACFGIDAQQFDTLFPNGSSWPPYMNGYDLQKKYGTNVTGDDGQLHSGSVIWYPVQGCTDETNCQLVEPSQFNFSGLVDFLNTLMTTAMYTVIYIHCEHGHDRTSALTGSYQMKYMGRTLDQVLNDGPPEGAKAFKHAWEVNYKELTTYYAGTIGK